MLTAMEVSDDSSGDLLSSASSDGCLSDEFQLKVPSELETQLNSVIPGLTSIGSPKKPLRIRKSSTSKNERIVQCGMRTLYTAGRPPWYDSHGQMKEAFVIGLTGGSASGKTTVACKIIEALDVPWVSVLSLDSFYKVLSEEQHIRAARSEYDFDHPDAFDFDLLCQTLKRLKKGKSVQVPVYNFVTHTREKNMKTIYGANVVIFEGILAFNSKALLELLDLKIFVDTDADVRLARRLRRDITQRKRDLSSVIKQYNTFVKPSFEHYIEPTMCHADIIVPRGGENTIALNLIVNHVHTQLLNRGFKFKTKLLPLASNGGKMPESLHVLENTNHVQSLHTIIRNRETSRNQFIFYANRLMRLLIEYAISLLPHKDFTVETSEGGFYKGRRLDCNKICGVSILRAGETMEHALCEVIKDIRLGKILIQTNHNTEEPELHYLRLLKDIKEHHVMLMDATVASGAAAVMAIRVLLDHDVPEENITLICLIMGQTGVHTIAYAFPKVKIVTTAVDDRMSEKFHIIPGLGNFGDRYFGTDFSDTLE